MSDTDRVENTEKKMEVIAKWRNAISITKSRDGGFNMSRFDKIEARWRQIVYFKTEEDIHDFIDWLDGVFPADESDDEYDDDDDSED